MNKVKDSKKGFTIIEVVVVLAIAGLIFGIVFWALPNLQRSNRDSSRRTIASNILANLDQHASNNNGTYPAANTAEFDTGFLTNFFTDGVADPLGGDFQSAANVPETTISYGAGTVDAPTSPVNHVLRYATSGQCGGASDAPGEIVSGGGQRAVAVSITLEQGGGYCVDNS